MAKRRKRVTHAKRHVATPHRKNARRRKTARRRKSGLSEMFNPVVAMASARAIGGAAIGGGLASAVSKMLSGQPTYQRISAGVIASFLTYAVGGFPNIACGMAGGFAAIETQPLITGLMKEEGDYFDYANPNSLNEMPIYLNEDGQAIYLNEDGQPYLADESIYLQESIYPEYSTQY